MAIIENIILYSLIAAVLLVGAVIFIGGNKNASLKKRKFVTTLSITIAFLFISYGIGLDYYLQFELKHQNVEYKNILSEYKQGISAHSLIADGYKIKMIDSLKSYIAKLNVIVYNADKYSSIMGSSNKKIVDSAVATISSAKTDLKELQEYNDTLSVKELMPNAKGYKTSSETSDFQFDCPNPQSSKYIDLNLQIKDADLVSNIGCVYIRIDRDSVLNENSFNLLFEQAYKPQLGTNRISIPNFTKQQNVLLRVGYILKDDLNGTYPKYYNYTCKYNINEFLNAAVLQTSN